MITSYEELITVLKGKLSEYLSLLEVGNPAKKFSCLHPDHDDKSPSMSLSQDGLFVKCFSCGRSGDIFTVANWLEDKPLTGEEFIKENVLYLADKFELKYSIINKNNESKMALKHAYLRAYKIVADYINEVADKNPTDLFREELNKRKWGKTKSTDFGIGCVWSFNDVSTLLKNNGFNEDSIKLLGLERSDLFNEDNLIFTIYDEFNRPIAFYARDIKYEAKKEAYEKRDKLDLKIRNPSKYNSTGNLMGIYEKQLHSYGLNDIKNCHKILIVEGHGCKHHLKLCDIHNVIALGGLELTETTLNKLKSLGVTKIQLVLDNDVVGVEKTKNIIRKYFGKTTIEFSVVEFGSIYPNVKDPDEFLRKYGAEKFNSLQEMDSLNWLIHKELESKVEVLTIIQNIIPLIVEEKSPLVRMQAIKTIAKLTNFAESVLTEEVNHKISLSKDRKGEYMVKVLEETKELLLNNPDSCESAMFALQSKLIVLNQNHDNEEQFSSSEMLNSLRKQQEKEDSADDTIIIKTGYEELDDYCELPTNEAFVLTVGPPNTGKSSFLISNALNILEYNKNAMVIMLTIDDARAVYVNRMISILSKIRMNWIKFPDYFLDKDRALLRSQAYDKIAEYVRDERLIIKDVNHGNSVEYYGRLIEEYRKKYSDRNIVAFCDNLHKLTLDTKSPNTKNVTQEVSALMKSYTTKYDCINWSTVEMTKANMYVKPTDPSAIADTASLQYDSNLIFYLWNDINVNREKSKLKFTSQVTDIDKNTKRYIYRSTEKPIIECLILKNKLSDRKGSVFFKFHPEIATFESISKQEVIDIAGEDSLT